MNDRVILDLCGGTGSWSRPYRDAGYDVRVVTLPCTDVRLFELPKEKIHGIPTPDGKIVMATLEGPVTASVGDWVIRGVKGEFYPCKPDIFEATYEPVSSPANDQDQHSTEQK